MIEQFLECTSRSWNAVPLFRPENAGRSTRKRSTRQCSTRGHITRSENQKLSLSSGCHNFVISSPILIIFLWTLSMFQKEYFYLGFDYVSPLYMPENGENNYSIHYQHVVTFLCKNFKEPFNTCQIYIWCIWNRYEMYIK